jgi:flagellin
MAITIKNDTNQININRFSQINQQKMDKSLLRLSTAQRLTSAGDDAAGVGIADRMNKTILSLSQYIQNTKDGLSIFQTADASLQQGSDIVQRMREISVQSANASLSDGDRNNLQKEIDQLKSQFKDIMGNTEFNGMKLLDGTYSDHFSGLNPDGQNTEINVNVDDVNKLIDTEINVKTQAGANNAISSLDDILNSISDTRADFGATMNNLESTVKQLNTRLENITAAKSQIADTDYMSEIGNFNKFKAMSKAGLTAQAVDLNTKEQFLKLLS